MKRVFQKPENFFFNHCYIFHAGHKPEHRFAQRFHQLIISHFIVGQHVQQAGVTLQVYAHVERPVDDALQVIDRFFKIAIAEMQGGNLIVEHENAVLVYEKDVFLQLFLDVWNQRQALAEGALHQVLVDACAVDINKGVSSEIVVVGSLRRFGEFQELPQGDLELLEVAQVKMRVQQVVHAFDVVAGLYADHSGFGIKQVDPFFGCSGSTSGNPAE